MELLSASGESNAVGRSSRPFYKTDLCTKTRVMPQVLARPRHVSMGNLTAAAAIYNSLYALPDDQGGGVCATFQIVSLSGWVRFVMMPLLMVTRRCSWR
jgi:hypothetical protein